MDDIASKFRQLIAEENLKRTLKNVLPVPEEQGDPFWVLMGVDRAGNLNGNYHTFFNDNGRVLPLFTHSENPESALRELNAADLVIRGVSRSHMRLLVEFQKAVKFQLGLFMLAEDESSVAYPNADDFRKMLEEHGHWHDEI